MDHAPTADARAAPKYSFVVPIYNDGALAEEFCDAFEAVFRDLVEGPLEAGVELIFVNDGSRDDSFAALTALAATRPWVRAIDLSRNFGQHIAISCGFAHARGDYIGYLNVDQEDRPDQIPPLLRALESGEYDLVVGKRRRRHGPVINRWTSAAFNWTLNRLTGYGGPLGEASLRVMNRRFCDAYNSLSERSRFIPGLERWLGFRRGYVEIEHQARVASGSSYTISSRLHMALESIISFSDFPLRLVTAVGSTVAALGFLALIALVIARLFVMEFRPGWPSLFALILLMGGLQIVVIGLASLYIGRILHEVQGRPLYLIQRRINFGDEVPAAAPSGEAQPVSDQSRAR